MHTLLVTAWVIVAMGIVLTFAAQRLRRTRATARAVVGGLLGANGLAVALSLGVFLLSFSNPMPVLAQTATAAPAASDGAMGAALATGLACIGAGIAVGIAGAAAIGGITEKPEILGRTLIFVGLAEGIAIYGLIISFMILNR